MTQTDPLNQAMARFDASLDTLEKSLLQLLEDHASVAKLKEQLRAVTEERNRLASERDRLSLELDAERGRARRLEDANSEVSGRLDAVMGTLREIGTGTSAEL